MRRLLAVAKDIDDDDFSYGFVCPTLIHQWERYLRHLTRRNGIPDIPERHRKNIGYRLQLLEFEFALLALHFEVRSRYRGASTLHETIACLKVHQFIVLCATVLEGLGSHLARQADTGGATADYSTSVSPRVWQAQLASTISSSISTDGATQIRNNLKLIWQWRHRIHLDRITEDTLDVNEFLGDDRFNVARATLCSIFNALNPDWPEGSCLSEGLGGAQ